MLSSAAVGGSIVLARHSSQRGDGEKRDGALDALQFFDRALGKRAPDAGCRPQHTFGGEVDG